MYAPHLVGLGHRREPQLPEVPVGARRPRGHRGDPASSGSSRIPYPSSVVGWTWITTCLDLSVAIGGYAPNVEPRHADLTDPGRADSTMATRPVPAFVRQRRDEPAHTATYVSWDKAASLSRRSLYDLPYWSLAGHPVRWNSVIERRKRFFSGASLMRHLNARVSVAVLCAIASTATAQGGSSDPRPARVTGRVADAVGSAIVKAEIRVTNTSFRAETGTTGDSSSPACHPVPSKSLCAGSGSRPRKSRSSWARGSCATFACCSHPSR